MAEDDEIDILGDFNLDNNGYDNTTLVSQNSDLLNCDYTIHPQWLLDKPSANPDNWYDSNAILCTEVTDRNNDDCLGHVSTENSINDESGWTEKEKNLLERGIEIFGKSNGRLSQFIGSKSASEVKYYLKNFYLENQSSCKSFAEGTVEEVNSNLISDVLVDTQIPASIEEVIAAVSTGKPTIQVTNKKARKRNNSNNDSSDLDIKSIHSGQSLLKTSYKPLEKSKSPQKYKNLQSVNKVHHKNRKKDVKFKFRTKIKMPMKENKNVKQKMVKIVNNTSKKTEISKVEITTGVGLSVPICEGEEIVKIQKSCDDSESDIEVDIEDTCESSTQLTSSNMKTSEQSKATEIKAPNTNIVPPQENKENKEIVEDKVAESTLQNHFVDVSTLNEATMRELMSMEIPQSEVILEPSQITELEKAIHNDFFEGRPTKTPVRYLKIRNHIINTWLSIKPSYVKKTSIRQGLKNCGDVNCLSRVHYFLEQIGAINFGCEQTNYVRPLYDMLCTTPPVKEKVAKDINKKPQRQICELGHRPRNKKKFNNDGEGGCTLTHDEQGQVINTTIVNEQPPKPRLYMKKPTIRLIYCRPFTDEKPQPFTIRIKLSTLLYMDFHAHTSLTEVMGLVAGYWNPHDKSLTVVHYEPCRNVASSTTHCDMCPISQAKAAEIIHNLGLEIIGWFHSHPTFAPEPSQQDLDTQQMVQQWIGHKKPCIGVILSPFSLNGALIASPYRCMVVNKKENFEDQLVPYKFKVDLVSNDFDVDNFLNDIWRILNSDVALKESRVNFCKPYFQDNSLTYLEKFITSVRMYLAKCGDLNKMTCDRIVQGISEICKSDVIS